MRSMAECQEVLMYTTMGELIQKKREQATLKLSELARISGVSKGVISKIENGDTKRPEFKTILPIAKALHIPFVQIIEHYIEVEQRPEVLREILMEAIQLSNLPLASKVALKFLQSTYEDSYTLVEQLYEIAGSVTDTAARLTLYDRIIKYARERGMLQFLAKALLQKYLIERLDLKRMEESFRAGEEITHYVDFLSLEERITFYFRMALQAYAIKKYKQCIELCEAGLALETVDTELKARAYLAMINSFSRLGNYDAVENHLEVFGNFRYDFVEEATKLTRAITKARKKEYGVAVPLLKECLEKIGDNSRIHVVNELLEIYFQTGDIASIAELIEKEKEVLTFDPKTPYKHLSLGRYFRYKGAFQAKTGSLEEGMESYLNSLLTYGEVSAFQEIAECMNDILTHFLLGSKAIDFCYVQKLKDVYNRIIRKNSNKKEVL